MDERKPFSGGASRRPWRRAADCAIAYSILARSLIRRQRDNHVLADAIGNDRKGSISIALYGAGIALSLL